MEANAGAPAGTPADEREEMRTARALLNRRLRVFLTDGRILLGNLRCIDRQGNLLLANTMEVRRREQAARAQAQAQAQAQLGVTNAGWEERKVGLVVVPERHRRRCEAKLTEEDAAILLVPSS